MKATTPAKAEIGMATPSSLFEGTFGFPLFRRLSHEFDEMFDRLGFERSFFEHNGGMWTPAVEVFTKDNEFVVRADLPGMKKEDRPGIHPWYTPVRPRLRQNAPCRCDRRISWCS